MSAIASLVGYGAATMTTVAFLPQVLHTLRTRDTTGISLGMYAAFTLGVALWFVYGVLLQAWPIIISNVVTLALAGSVLVLKLRHG